MPNACMMKNCSSSGRHDKLTSFHGFPQDPERCKAWVEACGRPELLQMHSLEYMYKNAHVCSLHFKQSDRNKKRLKPKAMPFPYDQIPNETKSTQTDTATNSNDSDSEIENYSGTSTAQDPNKGRSKAKSRATGMCKKQRLKKLQDKLKRLQEGENILKPELLKLIEFQTELYKLTKDKQYAEKLQLYALNLYLKCPTTYKCIRSSLTLPTENVLRRTNLEIDTVMSDKVLMSLNFKISSLKAVDRICAVSLKKMSLKRFLFYHINRDKIIGFRNINGEETMDPATEVYVLVARGLQAKWEQPLAYCFLGRNENKNNISPWLDSVLVSIINIGYDVVALVVDHEDLYDYCRNRIQSFSQPYFLFSHHVTKIYCIFDLPQLIISLRNTLMTHNLQFLDDDGSLVVADWEVIQSLHSGNNSYSTCSLLAKLTESHIHPNESEKKELKYAAEVFSKTVSEALDMESQMREKYDNRIRGTQKLTALVNDIFDILNSSALNHHNKCKNAFTGEPYQMKTIRQFMDFLTNVRPLNDCDVEDTSFNCIYGLRISIMSFSIILRDLLPKGINSLVTHRFNLDAADKLFEFVKQKSKSVKPIGVKFYKYFRQKFMCELMKYPQSTNQDDNLVRFLSEVDFKQMSRHKMKCDGFKKTIEVQTVDYRFELPKSHSFHYVCWYLMKKCYNLHMTCATFNRFLHEKVHGVNWKCYNWDSYFRPPDIFIDFVKALDERFNSSFGYKLNVGLGTGVLLVLNELKFELVCPCFPINYLRRLFVRLRIFNIIRYNNRQFWNEAFHFSGTDHYNIDIL